MTIFLTDTGARYICRELTLFFPVNLISRISCVNFCAAAPCRADGLGILRPLQFGTVSGLYNKDNRDGVHE